jgi:GT2 family glycosyltransferase
VEASVIIPCLNEGARLRRCVDAVAAQELDGPFEILVVDGGSDDGCTAALEGLPGVRVVHAPGTGAGEARNLGAEEARGRYLVFTDADCIPQAGWLALLVQALDEHPGLAGVGGGLRHLARTKPGILEDWDTRTFYRGIITSNAAYRPGPFHEVGGFDPALRCAEDWDLAWRLAEAGHITSHCAEAMVVHDPSENHAYGTFLRKQVWYACNDVPALLSHALHLRGRGTGVGAKHAREFTRTAMLHAAAAGMVGSVVLAPVGLGLLAGWGIGRAWRIARACPEARPHALRVMAHQMAKALARGAGTWAGLARLLREPLPAPYALDAPEERAPLRPVRAVEPAPLPAADADGPAPALTPALRP